jgi:hypothetical protein
MVWIIYFFILCSGIMAFDSITVGWGVALSIIGSSLFSVGGGGGLRSSLYFEFGHGVMGFILALIFMGIAYIWLGPMYSVGLWEHQLSGQEWSVIGFMVGFVCTSKVFAE